MWGSHGCKYTDHGFLGQNASQSGIQVSAFGGSSSLHRQGGNHVGRGNQFFRNDVTYLHIYQTTRPQTVEESSLLPLGY